MGKKERTKLIHQTVVEDLNELITQRASEGLTLNDVVRFSGYSKGYIQKVHTETTGETIGQLLKKRKLVMIIDEVKDFNTPTSLLCQEYGFSSLQAFCRHFKSMTGCTIRKCRKNIHCENCMSLKYGILNSEMT